MGYILLVLSVGVSLWFGIHWGVILGAIFVGVIAGLFAAKPTSSFQPALGLLIDVIALPLKTFRYQWMYRMMTGTNQIKPKRGVI